MAPKGENKGFQNYCFNAQQKAKGSFGNDLFKNFVESFENVAYKRVGKLNPNIFRTSKESRDYGQKQMIPGEEYRKVKRGSIFQKIDLDELDQTAIPKYAKTDQEM